ncbi:MAG: 4Fe-4S binding protein [Candidatus Alcyoniella australis]|nr:4Fe-4S binding protein [Candidatus Alcyoniella australis]
MDVYEQLRQVLDAHPSSAPSSPAFDEILRILFSEDEAALAAAMSFRPQPVEKIATAAQLDPDTTGQMLERLADRALVFCRRKEGRALYGLLPTIPGLFEFPFMRGKNTPELERLAELWERYHHDGLGDQFCGNPTPPMRVVPVEKSVNAELHVHPYEVVANLVRGADYIALTKCACRVSVAKCERPLEVCIIFGPPAEFLVERGYARHVDHDEALRALELSEAAGLVHTSNNSADRANLICNCCSCCCTVLRGLTQVGNPHAIATSAFVAAIDAQACTGCAVCADDRCPIEAIVVTDGTALVDAERCIGCGLCVSTCPANAIRLREREQRPAICETVQQMGLQMAQEKGRLERLIEIMSR